jgi:8-oxo-dGTP pyrophosphatase MutT (NUDIX family)
VTITEAPSTSAASLRTRLQELIAGIIPWDSIEQQHLAEAAAWVADGSPLYRTGKPDVPPKHLVCYFVVQDETDRVLLVAHRKAGLWLPAGGHVEELEDPWHTVARECREELGIEAQAAPLSGQRPFFLTITPTNGPGSHIDVSLWYLLSAAASDIDAFDTTEFTAVRWVALPRLLDEPIESLDPHMHRFGKKLADAKNSIEG